MHKSASKGVVVLVVEDEPTVSETTAHALHRFGYRVLGPVPTAAEALRLLDSEIPDAAILDPALRDDASYIVADALMESGVPFAFLTGPRPEDLPFGYAFQAVLSKPLTRPELRAALEHLVPSPVMARVPRRPRAGRSKHA